MRCARCDDELSAIETSEGVTVDFCRSCSGTFYDAGEFPTMFHVDLPPLSPEAEGDRPCPRCQTPMAEQSIGDEAAFAIDRCRSCGGLWLDQGETLRLRDNLIQSKRVGPQWKKLSSAGGPTVWIPVRVEKKGLLGLSGRWVALGALVMAFNQLVFTGLLGLVITLEVMGKGDVASLKPYVLIGGSLMAFPIGGYIIARLSRAHTTKEAALACVPAIAIFIAMADVQLSTLAIAGVSMAGFVLTYIGAAVGEGAG